MFRRLLVIGLLVVAAAAPNVALAADPDLLPLPGFGDIAVDDANRRVFVSGGSAANSVLVADHNGRVKKLDNQYGATGLVLSQDGKTLYVALASGDAISAVNTATFTETARYPTGAQTCPTHLARTGDVVWFGYGCTDSWSGGIGRLDPSASPPISLAEHGDALFQNAPLVTSADTTVVAGQLATSLSSLHVFHVTATGGLEPRATNEAPGSNLTDIALSPDAATVYTAAGSRTFVQALATEDLSGRGSYHTGPYPNAVVTSADNVHLITGAYTTRTKAINIFQAGATVPARSYGLDGSVLANRGLAWSADKKYLYAILQGPNGGSPRLAVINRPLD